jgi:4-diphosphocytidyl-2-C-methyl-D-erythritol kinase
MPSFDAVIVKPPFGLATADVYRAFDALPSPEPDDRADPPAAMPELAGWVRNDLWAAATSVAPELRDLADRLAEAGARCTVLCGSGSAIAALVGDRAAAERLAAHWDARDVVFPVSCRGL